jgi:hypothetical protein
MRKAPNVKEHLANNILREIVTVNEPENETKHTLLMAQEDHAHRG